MRFIGLMGCIERVGIIGTIAHTGFIGAIARIGFITPSAPAALRKRATAPALSRM
jgi:hypothetical protein